MTSSLVGSEMCIRDSGDGTCSVDHIDSGQLRDARRVGDGDVDAWSHIATGIRRQVGDGVADRGGGDGTCSVDHIDSGQLRDGRRVGDGDGAVSYTHLTLPTILLV